MRGDDGVTVANGVCLSGSITLFKIWEIWMYAFIIGLPYARKGIFSGDN